MGVSASAHRVSCAHDPLKPHPVRQDVHSAQEMTLIDRTLFTEHRGEAAGENEAICTMAVLGWCCTFTRGGTCVCVCVLKSMQVHAGSVHLCACLVPFEL